MKNFTVLLLLLAVACTASKKTPPMANDPSSLYNVKWQLSSLNGAATPGTKAFLLFFKGTENRVTGNTSCNNLNSTVTLSGNAGIQFGAGATTRMACMGDNVEQPFLDMLKQADGWQVSGNKLSLMQGSKTLAVFDGSDASADLSRILNGKWELTYVTGPRIAFEGLYTEKIPSIEFKVDEKQVGGNNSCNGYGGSFTLDGDKLAFGPMRSTMMACPGTGEETYMKALEKVNRYQIENGNVLVLLADEVPMLKFKRGS